MSEVRRPETAQFVELIHSRLEVIERRQGDHEERLLLVRSAILSIQRTMRLLGWAWFVAALVSLIVLFSR